MKFLLNTIATAIAVWVTTLLPLGLAVGGGEDEWWQRVLVFLGVAAIIVLVNTLVTPVLTFLSLPLLILTLGLFMIVIAWLSLWIAAWVSELVPWVELTIGGFWETLGAAIVIAIVSSIIGGLLGARKDEY